MGEMSWKVDNSSISHSIMNGGECVTFGGGAAAFYLGWPADAANALNLKAGSYTLSYRASSTGPLSVKIESKAVDPYTDDLPLTTDAVGVAVQTFTHAFTVTTGDTKAGVAFKISPGATASQMTTVCFDDVSLTKQ